MDLRLDLKERMGPVTKPMYPCMIVETKLLRRDCKTLKHTYGYKQVCIMFYF